MRKEENLYSAEHANCNLQMAFGKCLKVHLNFDAKFKILTRFREIPAPVSFDIIVIF